MQVKVKWLFEQAPHWNKSDWAEIEDEALKFAGKSSWQNWDFVASKLDTNRTAFMCFERSHFLNKKLNSKRFVILKNTIRRIYTYLCILELGLHVKTNNYCRWSINSQLKAILVGRKVNNIAYVLTITNIYIGVFSCCTHARSKQDTM
jgi:hypothetical protein